MTTQEIWTKVEDAVPPAGSWVWVTAIVSSLREGVPDYKVARVAKYWPDCGYHPAWIAGRPYAAINDPATVDIDGEPYDDRTRVTHWAPFTMLEPAQ